MKSSRRDYIQLLIEAKELNSKKETNKFNDKDTQFSHMHVEKTIDETVNNIL